jgi:hypothetical protein
MIKALKKLGIERMFLNKIKAIYNKLRANIILNGEQLKPFPLKSGMRLSAFSIPIQYSFDIPSKSNKTRARNKRIQIGKEEVKLSLFAEDMILCLRDPKNLTKKLLEITNSFSKVAGYKIKYRNQ